MELQKNNNIDYTVVKDGEKWVFDDNVAMVFSNMLERSIPEYQTMRDLVKKIGSHYVQVGKTIIDIGCSDGIAIEPFIKTYGPDCNYKLYDVSEPMLERCKQRYSSNEFGSLSIENYDIRNGIQCTNVCLLLSILTLQFVPIEYRHKIVQSIYQSLCPGGAFILVEKVLGDDPDIDSLFVDEYYKIKSDNLYTQEQIASKRKSLEGVLVPITSKWNVDLLLSAGFKKVDCFWKCLNFCGWVAIK